MPPSSASARKAAAAPIFILHALSRLPGQPRAGTAAPPNTSLLTGWRPPSRRASCDWRGPLPAGPGQASRRLCIRRSEYAPQILHQTKAPVCSSTWAAPYALPACVLRPLLSAACLALAAGLPRHCPFANILCSGRGAPKLTVLEQCLQASLPCSSMRQCGLCRCTSKRQNPTSSLGFIGCMDLYRCVCLNVDVY